jgi:hypothetical protein
MMIQTSFVFNLILPFNICGRRVRKRLTARYGRHARRGASGQRQEASERPSRLSSSEISPPTGTRHAYHCVSDTAASQSMRVGPAPVSTTGAENIVVAACRCRSSGGRSVSTRNHFPPVSLPTHS